MLLKENTQYVLRNGTLVGPLYQDKDGLWLQESSERIDGYIGIWKDNGKSDFFLFEQEPEYDIVSEVE